MLLITCSSRRLRKVQPQTFVVTRVKAQWLAFKASSFVRCPKDEGSTCRCLLFERSSDVRLWHHLTCKRFDIS